MCRARYACNPPGGRQIVDTDPSPWIRRSSRTIYENPWIRLREDRVVRPDGNRGIYGVVEFKSWSIAIVPVTEDGDTFLVGQHRYPRQRFSWEVPQGGGPPRVPPLEGARRELREETGISAQRWTSLGDAYPS